MCEIQEQAATSSPKTRLYADLGLSASVYNKALYLRCRLDSQCIQKMFHDYSLSKLEPVQANLRM